jgi:hypothetical protein
MGGFGLISRQGFGVLKAIPGPRGISPTIAVSLSGDQVCLSAACSLARTIGFDKLTAPFRRMGFRFLVKLFFKGPFVIYTFNFSG